MPSEGLRFPNMAEPVTPEREPRATAGDHHCSQDHKDEDGGLEGNTGVGCVAGASCYCAPYPLTAIGNGGDNYDNDDGRSLAELGKDYNGLMNAIEDELCAV